MKKRKNVILSAITCFVSICLLMIGVYAASSPSVSIGGQVSYTDRDAKVLVQGKINGAKGQSSIVDYPSATVTPNAVTATKVTTENGKVYLDYTAGTGNSEQDDLSPWKIGTLEFLEDNTGVKDITISFKLTNLSTYPVKASITFARTEAELTASNLERVVSATKVKLSQNGGNQEVVIKYSVKDDSKNIDAVSNTNLLGMEIKFSKDQEPVATPVSSEYCEEKNYNIRAYSEDGITFSKTRTTNSQYGLIGISLCSGYGTVENKNGKGYYFSKYRELLQQEYEKAMNGESNSLINREIDEKILKAIVPRTIESLYKNNWYDESQSKYVDVPLMGADGSEADFLWVASSYEWKNFDLAQDPCDMFGWGRDGARSKNFSLWNEKIYHSSGYELSPSELYGSCDIFMVAAMIKLLPLE